MLLACSYANDSAIHARCTSAVSVLRPCLLSRPYHRDMTRRAVVTGVFSYTGGAIARQLLDRGDEVVSLSRRPAPAGHQLAGAVAREPLQFNDPELLVRSLEGADVLFNTYWIRFPREGADFASAVANSRALFAAAGRAGVRRIVHLSVTNAAGDSPYAYFRGKAEVEAALAEATSEHAVIRPSLVFGGREEILVNNMAWLLRKLPVYAVPGTAATASSPYSSATWRGSRSRLRTGPAHRCRMPSALRSTPSTSSSAPSRGRSTRGRAWCTSRRRS